MAQIADMALDFEPNPSMFKMVTLTPFFLFGGNDSVYMGICVLIYIFFKYPKCPIVFFSGKDSDSWLLAPLPVAANGC